MSLPFHLEAEDFSVLRTLKILLSDFCKLNVVGFFFPQGKNISETCLFKRNTGGEFELKILFCFQCS